VSAISLFAVIGNLLMSNDICDLAAYSVSSTVPAFGAAVPSEDVVFADAEERHVPESGNAADGESEIADQKAVFDDFSTKLKRGPSGAHANPAGRREHGPARLV